MPAATMVVSIVDIPPHNILIIVSLITRPRNKKQMTRLINEQIKEIGRRKSTNQMISNNNNNNCYSLRMAHLGCGLSDVDFSFWPTANNTYLHGMVNYNYRIHRHCTVFHIGKCHSNNRLVLNMVLSFHRQ